MSAIANSPLWPDTPVKVVLFDLWRTIGRGPYPEPITDFRKMLGLDGKVDEDLFLRVCLTTSYEDPYLYMLAIAKKFGITAIPDTALGEFEALIRREKNGLCTYADVKDTLIKLKDKGYRLGMVTNSWPFPVRALLQKAGLEGLFEHIICSAACGFAKQDGSEIYFLAATTFGVRPEECVMVGDNPSLDVVPALAAKVRAVLIDRDEIYVNDEGVFKDPRLGALGIPFIFNMDELPSALG